MALIDHDSTSDSYLSDHTYTSNPTSYTSNRSFISDSLESGSFIDDTDESDYVENTKLNSQNKYSGSNTNFMLHNSTSQSNGKFDPEKIVKVKNKKAFDLTSIRSKQSHMSIRQSLISNLENQHISHGGVIPERFSQMSQSSKFSKVSMMSLQKTKDRKGTLEQQERFEPEDDYDELNADGSFYSNTIDVEKMDEGCCCTIM